MSDSAREANLRRWRDVYDPIVTAALAAFGAEKTAHNGLFYTYQFSDGVWKLRNSFNHIELMVVVSFNESDVPNALKCLCGTTATRVMLQPTIDKRSLHEDLLQAFRSASLGSVTLLSNYAKEWNLYIHRALGLLIQTYLPFQTECWVMANLTEGKWFILHTVEQGNIITGKRWVDLYVFEIRLLVNSYNELNGIEFTYRGENYLIRELNPDTLYATILEALPLAQEKPLPIWKRLLS